MIVLNHWLTTWIGVKEEHRNSKYISKHSIVEDSRSIDTDQVEQNYPCKVQ